ncbi:MAG: right-handed parallel beta-helix repeat-containing protein [bacterium]|nr:right-handed parallel beta-helix repeat-containing protein [bacterium]
MQSLAKVPYRTIKMMLCCAVTTASLAEAALAATRSVPAQYGTITAALAAASSGDTILVGAGTYAPSTNGEVYPLTVDLDDLVILGEGSEQTVLDAEESGSVIFWQDSVGGRLSGFRITGGQADNGGGIDMRGGNSEIDHNLIIHNTATLRGAAVYVIFDASPWFHHNVVWENFDLVPEDEADPHGIILSGTTTALVEHNLIGRADGNGLLISNQGDPIIRYNIFYENGRTEPTRRGRGICDFSAVPVPKLQHNLFWGNEIAALLYPVGGGNIASETANELATDDTIFGNIDADPLLTAPDMLNFALQSGSPAIDAGSPSVFSDPDGTIADLGPFYYDQSLSTVADVARSLVIAFRNVPNPFNPSTRIHFDLRRESFVTLRVYSPRGGLVRELCSGHFPAGAHAVSWDGRDARGANVASGVYPYRIVTDQGPVSGRLTLVR